MYEGFMTYQWFPPDLCWKCPTGCQSCNAEVVNPGWKVTFGKEPKELSLNAGTVNLVSKKKKPYHSFCIQILGLHYLQRGTDVSKGLLFLVRLHGCLEYLIAHEKHGQRGVQNWPIFERPRMRVIEFSHVFFSGSQAWSSHIGTATVFVFLPPHARCRGVDRSLHTDEVNQPYLSAILVAIREGGFLFNI